ncbi:hypothetical protein NU09_0893 [Flavobacterium beibuense]|uniref:Uncharacterized protein n=2 Tax=Flavobacterium beibuense TaxID=657326 RepID=A0A444WEK5_9FLAO|nr:hypothetical protein NU09_0893 [Flavobacterium beibuense]
MVLPVAAFALASAGAVSTSDSTVSKTAKPLITAYIHDPLESSCKAVSVNCNTISGPTCTYSVGGNTWTAYRRLSDQSPCTLPLFMDQP